MKKQRVVVLQVEVEVGIGVLDGKFRHVEEIGLRVEEEEGTAAAAAVGKKVTKTGYVASIEDHVHSDDLKKRMISFFKIVHICAIIIQGEKTTE